MHQQSYAFNKAATVWAFEGQRKETFGKQQLAVQKNMT
jgi:hypothetical protein